VSSTMPTNSWPSRAGGLSGVLDAYGHRSLPQMVAAVCARGASVGSLMTEPGRAQKPRTRVRRMRTGTENLCANVAALPNRASMASPYFSSHAGLSGTAG